ncbi:MAG: methyltransferase domain-containing protein [Desulfohalobiaceae bacterium]|nr:methyltransferase domain-containing protein [Desulfohalobiaceae bacterium]
MDPEGRLFDSWPQRYDRWFETPAGKLIKRYESRVMLDLLRPGAGELIFDGGCGTGIFTRDVLACQARVVGLDVSLPMLVRASEKCGTSLFWPVAGDLLALPFATGLFDRVVSMTTLEFIENGREAVNELFRVTRRGGSVVVTTLNSLSSWAERRRAKAEQGDPFFERMIFRSPDELNNLAPLDGELRTAIHFSKEEDPALIPDIEEDGRQRGLLTGALLAVRWVNP